MSDKRVYQRSPVELAASYGVPEAQEISESATVVNISGGGFCIESDKIVKAGTDIDLKVELENNEEVTIKVRSAWAKKVGDTGKYMIGVQITEADGPEFEKFLSFYCEQVKKVQEELK